jgi:hypothetical protein
MAIYCTNNREYDYGYNAFHINTEDTFSVRMSANYLSALGWGTKFSHRGKASDFISSPMPSEEYTIAKILSFALAWFAAIATFGLLPYLAKKSYLATPGLWENATALNCKAGSLLQLETGQRVFILSIRSDEQGCSRIHYIAKNLIDLKDFCSHGIPLTPALRIQNPQGNW